MTSEQISQTLSLLTAHQMLSLRSIMLELSITRSEARTIMEEVANQCGDGYEAVRIGSADGSVSLGKQGSIFSIIKSDGDQLQSTIAANEKSLSDQRDLASTADGWNELLHIFSDKEIQTAPEYLEGGAIRRVARERGTASSSAANFNAKSQSIKPAKKAKETTAAAFFAKKETKKPEKKTASTNNNKEVKGKENNKSTEPETKSKPTKPEPKPESKTLKKSANVDDFEGDEDEDEEFLQQESERKARVGRQARQQVRASVVNEAAKRRNTGSLAERRKANPKSSEVKDDVEMKEEPKAESDDDEVEYDDVNVKNIKMGGIDSFAKRTATTSGGAKKRRKKLVEKTVMENGYLKTVTEEVWEDVEEEEVKAAPVSKPAASKAKSVKGKKQGSLMGFFTKK